FVGAGGGINQTEHAGDNAERLQKIAEPYGRKVGAYTLLMIIADRTDELAWEKWEYYKSGTDMEAIEWRKNQAGADKNAAANSTGGGRARRAAEMLADKSKAEPAGMLRLIGSYENVARMLDEIAANPAIEGIMMTFDDFIIGIEQFGQYIQPLMKSRQTDI